MANQENKCNGGNTNQKKGNRRFFRKKTGNKPNSNGNNNGSSQKTQAKREMKFHMHDSQARKQSESYEKIKKSIILKIQESFDDSKYVVESLKKKRQVPGLGGHFLVNLTRIFP